MAAAILSRNKFSRLNAEFDPVKVALLIAVRDGQTQPKRRHLETTKIAT
jgi:hypothetical protein